MSMAEAGRPIVDWSPRDDAHSGLRNADRPAARPTGRVQHGYNRVQEIVSDTDGSHFGATGITVCHHERCAHRHPSMPGVGPVLTTTLLANLPELGTLTRKEVAALVATRRNLLIRTFYLRLCQAGKAKKLALTACMRKLLTILNAMVKSGTPWRHDAELVGAEAEERVDSRAIVVRRPMVCDDFLEAI